MDDNGSYNDKIKMVACNKSISMILTKDGLARIAGKLDY